MGFPLPVFAKPRTRGYLTRPPASFSRRQPSGGVGTASFHAAFADAGAGVVSTSLTLGTGSATFTRVGAAWTRLSTLLWASVASGSPRSYYDAAGTYLGYFAEGTRTNFCLWSNDFTNVAWTATGGAAVLTATGPDGVVNSASTLTSALANATFLQAITRSSAARLTGCFIKRRTGTGNIDITQDNGSTWTTITVTAGWTQVEIAGVTSANPTVGIRLVTALDAVDVWGFQHEELTVVANLMSSPIPTTTVAVTRNNDVMTYPQSGNGFTDTAGTVYAEVACFNRSSVGAVFGGGASTTAPMTKNSPNNNAFIGDGTNAASLGNATWANSSLHKVASSWSASGINVAFDGTTGTRASYDGSLIPATNILIGAGAGPSFVLFGTIKNAKVFPTGATDADLIGLTSPPFP